MPDKLTKCSPNVNFFSSKGERDLPSLQSVLLDLFGTERSNITKQMILRGEQLVDAAVQHGRLDGQHRDRLPVARHLRRPRPLRLRRLHPLQVSQTRGSRNL